MGDGDAGVGSGGGVVAVSAYMCGTRGSTSQLRHVRFLRYGSLH